MKRTEILVGYTSKDDSAERLVKNVADKCHQFIIPHKCESIGLDKRVVITIEVEVTLS